MNTIQLSQCPGWKELVDATLKAAKSSANFSVALNQRLLFDARLQELKVTLQKVYPDKAQANRIYDRVVADAGSRTWPDQFIPNELDFEIRLACAGGTVQMTFDVMEDIIRHPATWEARKNRNRE